MPDLYSGLLLELDTGDAPNGATNVVIDPNRSVWRVEVAAPGVIRLVSQVQPPLSWLHRLLAWVMRRPDTEARTL